jgi:hypothetical protein
MRRCGSARAADPTSACSPRSERAGDTRTPFPRCAPVGDRDWRGRSRRTLCTGTPGTFAPRG